MALRNGLALLAVLFPLGAPAHADDAADLLSGFLDLAEDISATPEDFVAALTDRYGFPAENITIYQPPLFAFAPADWAIRATGRDFDEALSIVIECGSLGRATFSDFSKAAREGLPVLSRVEFDHQLIDLTFLPDLLSERTPPRLPANAVRTLSCTMWAFPRAYDEASGMAGSEDVLKSRFAEAGHSEGIPAGLFEDIIGPMVWGFQGRSDGQVVIDSARLRSQPLERDGGTAEVELELKFIAIQVEGAS